MGTMTLAAVGHLAAGKTQSGSSPFTLIFLVVAFGLVYVLFMRPQRARQRKAMQTQSQVMPGQRIRTTAGMYGTVVSGDDRDVVIEVAPGVHVTMLRRAIMEVLPDDAPDDVMHDDMPHHEDLVAEHGEEAEQEHEDTTPADDQDLKDRKNI
ncbi:MAG TPA: preprotein translocase subunit YajC [Streptosporangiaceae bacterium]